MPDAAEKIRKLPGVLEALLEIQEGPFQKYRKKTMIFKQL